MYEETACFDPNSSIQDIANNGFSQPIQDCTSLTPPRQSTFIAGSSTNSFEELTFANNPPHDNTSAAAAAAAMEMEIQQHMGYNMDNNNTDLMQEMITESNQVLSYEQTNWDPDAQAMQDMNNFNDPTTEQKLQQAVHHEMQNGHQNLNLSQTPDLLNLLQLPRCSNASSLFPNSSISFANFTDTSHASSVLYNPLLHLNLPPQPPVFRELFQSLPNGYNLPVSRGSSLFNTGDERDADGGVYQDGDGRQFENGVLEFTSEMACMGKKRKGKMTKHFATERDRRIHYNDKFKLLSTLVPNPTKQDRASVVGDAINYINELNRTVNELKILVERKRVSRERKKRLKAEEDGDVESCNMKPLAEADLSLNGSLRSSWLQRKSKYDTEVDVRIVDDDVTIKLVQRKKMNCLLFVSKTLDELQLDLLHVAGGIIGEHCSFLFNTKIYNGSSVYASAIANRLIEVVDRQYAASSQSTNSY